MASSTSPSTSSSSSWLASLRTLLPLVVVGGGGSNSTISSTRRTLLLAAAAATAIAASLAVKYRRTIPVVAALALTYFPAATALSRARRPRAANLHPNHSFALESLVATVRWLLNGEIQNVRRVRVVTAALAELEFAQAKGELEGDGAVEVRVARGAGRVSGVWIENGVRKPARGTEFRPEGLVNKAVLLYAHGGGMNVGSARSYALHHVRLVEAFNKITERNGSSGRRRRLAVFSVEYPLAPENTHPAQIDAVEDAYRWLTEDLGVRDVYVGGDSAGGLLALQLVARVRARGGREPSKAVLISPWVDPAGAVAVPARRFVFDYLGKPLGRFWFGNYFPAGLEDGGKRRVEGEDAPLKGIEPGSGGGVPPVARRTMVVYGDAEVLAEPIERFIEAVRAARAEVEGKEREDDDDDDDDDDPDRLRVVVGEGMPHEYPMLCLNLPGAAGRLAREAVEREAAFLARV